MLSQSRFQLSLPPNVCAICPLTKFCEVFNSLILSVCSCPLTFSQRCTSAVPEPCLLITALCKNEIVLFQFCVPISSAPLCHLRIHLPALRLRKLEALPASDQLRPQAQGPGASSHVCVLAPESWWEASLLTCRPQSAKEQEQ